MLFDGAVCFSASVRGRRPQPFNPFLSVTLPHSAGAFHVPSGSGRLASPLPGTGAGENDPRWGEGRPPGAGQETSAEVEGERGAGR